MDSTKRQALELERDRLLAAARDIDDLMTSKDRRTLARAGNRLECLRKVDEIVTVYRKVFPMHFMDRDKLMYGSERATAIVARAVTMYLLKFYFKMTYVELGRIFSRDHSSCLYLANKCMRAITVPTDEAILTRACLAHFGLKAAHPIHDGGPSRVAAAADEPMVISMPKSNAEPIGGRGEYSNAVDEDGYFIPLKYKKGEERLCAEEIDMARHGRNGKGTASREGSYVREHVHYGY